MQETLYRDILLDHYKNPRNFGSLENYSIRQKEYNPLCGDEIELFLEIKDKTIKDVKFNGQGCAVSIAASSMLSEIIKNKNISYVNKLTDRDMFSILGIQVGVNRRKCVTLCLKALKDGLKNEPGD